MRILNILTSRRIKGNTGEDYAAKFLKRRGFRILERNYVSRGHEIDIIAHNKDTVIFVEVKTRTKGLENPKEPRPASSVNKEKQKAIIMTAKGYLAFTRPDKHIRFDIIEVYLNEKGKPVEICHMESAFTADTAYKKY